MSTKTCCITGHRTIEEGKIEIAKATIRKALIQAVNCGYNHFISGFAKGIDLYFAEIIIELRERYDISLEAAIPYRNRIRSKDTNFQNLISQCNLVSILSEKYSPSCYINRNRYMVQHSNLIIAVYDGRYKGGTLFTMRYAHALGKEIKIINL